MMLLQTVFPFYMVIIIGIYILIQILYMIIV
uniref:Dolichol-phosphate mannosyltransferase subunit n=1 Tax=Siphoviridae sp. ct3r22 TaxID=2825325 RepID=A0A8S5V166_9CAUD|nr:MAG TPA: Dolichol-phosphate mannosyltransferase subunit [Siphoviridae sp. ct3r22]